MGRPDPSSEEMGCTHSLPTISMPAMRRSAPRRAAPAEELPAPTGQPAAASEERASAEVGEPVLLEVPVEEKALAQLKLIFDAVNTSGDGSVSKSELSAALEKDASLRSLIKEAGMNEEFYVLNQLDSNGDHLVSWHEFQAHLKKTAVQEVQVSGNVAAAQLAVEEKVKKQLKELFDSLDKDEDGAVNKEELAAGLGKDREECNGCWKKDSLGQFIEQAGFMSSLDKTLSGLDTNKDGAITWDEFEAHLHSAASKEVQDHGAIASAVVLEDEMKAQACWGPCWLCR